MIEEATDFGFLNFEWMDKNFCTFKVGTEKWPDFQKMILDCFREIVFNCIFEQFIGIIKRNVQHENCLLGSLVYPYESSELMVK